MPDSGRKPLRGSGRDPAPGAQPIGEGFHDEPIEVTVRVRPRPFKNARVPAERLSTQKLGMLSPRKRKYIERNEYKELYGAEPSDLEIVRTFASGFGLVDTGSCAAGRSLKFKGSVGQMNEAFDTTLTTYRYAFGEYRGRAGELLLPTEVAP